MKSILLSALILAIIAISGCTNQANKKITDAYFCNTDSDCKIKDVHNCCGYFPRCVNKDYIPDTEAVTKECKAKGIVSVCGWPEISSCRCIENKCNSIQEGSVV